MLQRHLKCGHVNLPRYPSVHRFQQDDFATINIQDGGKAKKVPDGKILAQCVVGSIGQLGVRICLIMHDLPSSMVIETSTVFP